MCQRDCCSASGSQRIRVAAGRDDCPQSDDTNITVETAYNADGNVASITAVNAVTGNQTTQYVYGTTLADSEVASSLLKRQEIYPDSVDGSDTITFEYNRQRQETVIQDQGGTVHAYDYDKLGRRTQDRVTTLGTGVDGAVRRMAMSYEVRGMVESITSYDNATVGAGSIAGEVQFAYNDFGQIETDYQAHAGAVNTMSTPKVQYGYASGSANTIRPTTLTYPNGRVLTYDYGAADSLPDALSRVDALVDDDMASTHLADYEYLGLGTFVEQDDTQPEIKWTMIDLAGTNDPDTGDVYSGFDRFGRVKDNRWYDYGSSADVDRIKYGYDRASNRIWRQNPVADALSKPFDELYTNDLIHRLKTLARGTLDAGHSSLDTTTFAECWTLDPTGNWKKYLEDTDGDGTWDLNQARTANTVNEITAITETAGPSWVTPTYSPAGNMTTVPQPADPTQSFSATYDAWNRLVKLVDGANTVAEYAYDGAKRRVIQKSYTGGTLDETRHLYYTEPSMWQVIEERVDPDTDPNRQFVWGKRYIDDLVMRDRDTTGNGTLDERLYAMQDANWNVTATCDTGGTVQERYAYSAYGTPSFLTASFGSSAPSYDWETLYAGYRWDADSELTHVRHRVYNAVIGIWLQRDPLAWSAGASLYRYAGSRPIALTDSDGQICGLDLGLLDDVITCTCALAGIADIIGLGIGPVDLIDCGCNILTTINQACEGRLACGPQALFTLLDCGSGPIGCTIGGIVGAGLGGPTGNIILMLALAGIGCVVGDALLDAILTVLQYLNDQGEFPPSETIAACGRVLDAAGDLFDGLPNIF